MASFNNLSIENFRGFDKIELRDFNQVNILLGNNNSGKSSILEALFLLIGMNNPSLPAVINNLRGMQFTQSGFLKSVFHNLDITKIPIIKGIYENGSTRELQIEPIFNTNMQSANAISSTMQGLVGLEIYGKRMLNQEHETSRGRYIIENGQENISTQKELPNVDMDGVFISSSKGDGFSLSMLADLIKKKSDSLILKELQKFDNRINAIKILPDNVYFDIEGIDELLQVNLVGDGMRRFLNIISTIANSANKIILIDEIETGLHHSANQLLWQSILSISSNLNVQLFITTHSVETLQCLNALLEKEENAQYRTAVNLYTIARTRLKGFQSYLYRFKDFNMAINNEIELRD